MVVLDGFRIVPGQMVYDISANRGQGTVISADQHGITVNFGAKRVSYNTAGVADRANFRTLYHVPPIIIPMTGNAARDAAVQTIMEVVTGQIKEVL